MANPMPGRGRATDRFDQAIIAPTAGNGVLRPQSFSDHLKRRARIVIQPADELGIEHIADTNPSEEVGQRFEMLTTRLAEKCHGLRRVAHDGTAALLFTVEYPQRIALVAALALRAELIQVATDVTLELLTIARSADRIPQGIQVQLQLLQSKPAAERS